MMGSLCNLLLLATGRVLPVWFWLPFPDHLVAGNVLNASVTVYHSPPPVPTRRLVVLPISQRKSSRLREFRPLSKVSQ